MRLYALLAVAASWRGARAQRPIAGRVSPSRDGARGAGALQTLSPPVYDLTSSTKGVSWPGGPSISQSREDAALYYTYFARDPTYKGTFVEIGALDGHQFSNTEWFESQLGWKGLLVEGAPGNAAKLMRPGNRPGSKKFPMAVCDAGVGFVMMQGGGATAADLGLASDGFIKQWHHGRRNHGVKVPCKPFGKLLRVAGFGEGIDVASIDVEGAELKVISTHDWTIPVRVWVVEMDAQDPPKDAAVRALLKQKGYCRAPLNLKQYCGQGPPAQPRPKYPSCTTNEVFEPCRPELLAAEAACPLDKPQTECA